jgi:hypothetical protein
MTKSTAACNCADLSSPSHPDPGKIHKPIDAGERHFSLSESKNLHISPSFIREHLAIGRACLQQSIAKNANHEIML